MKFIWLVSLFLCMPFLNGCRDALINHFAFFPDKVVPDIRIDVPGISEIFLVTKDDVRIHCLYIDRRVGESITNNVVLFFHGNAGNAYQRIPDMLALSEEGISVMLVSYRGYGKSEGTPSEHGIYNDAEAAYKYLTDTEGFKPINIYILGRSIGSAAAVHVAQDKRIGGLILITPISSGKEVAASIGLGWMTWPMKPFFDNVEKIKRVKSPVLVIHGDADEIIPFDAGKKIYEAVPIDNKQFIRIKDAGHNNLIQVAGKNFWPLIRKFIYSAGSNM